MVAEPQNPIDEPFSPDQTALQAVALVASAREMTRAGSHEAAIRPLERAVVLFAAVEPQISDDDPTKTDLRRSRAEACRLLADGLNHIGQDAEAANVYQEATDLYGLLDTPADTALADECAAKLIGIVQSFRVRPKERLNLLVAHYDRLLIQMQVEPGSSLRQAEMCVHVARVLQRRDRPEEALARYEQALGCYQEAGTGSDIQMGVAECHHRIANLLVNYLADLDGAARHFQNAIALYEVYELPVYGQRQSCEICRTSLKQVEAQLKSDRVDLDANSRKRNQQQD